MCARSGPGGPGRRGARARRALGLALALGALAWIAATAEPLRVATSGDYAPFSTLGPEGRGGFDVTVAEAFARDRGRPLRFVPLRWPALLDDLRAGRFDVAMSGVTVRPERSRAGRFSVPVAESGALVLAPPALAAAGLDALDDPRRHLAVNAGGHLERAARARFPHARLVPVPDNGAVLDRLLAGEADAVVTDTLEAPHWEARAPELVRLGPFTRDRKAYLLPPGADALAETLDAWLLAREADGQLGAWRRAALGPLAAATATPLDALVAALDERLSLMPDVAEAKRAAGAPVEVPEREAAVLRAARRAVADAAREADRPPPADAAVAAFFRAQFAAARALQRARLARPPGPGPAPDLERALRPALIRIGDRVAWLLVRLPADTDPAAARAAVRDGLAVPDLPAAAREALADALVGLLEAPRDAAAAGR